MMVGCRGSDVEECTATCTATGTATDVPVLPLQHGYISRLKGDIGTIRAYNAATGKRDRALHTEFKFNVREDVTPDSRKLLSSEKGVDVSFIVTRMPEALQQNDPDGDSADGAVSIITVTTGNSIQRHAGKEKSEPASALRASCIRVLSDQVRDLTSVCQSQSLGAPKCMCPHISSYRRT